MEYLIDVFKLLKKVSWASWSTSLKKTAVALLILVIACLFYWGLNVGIESLIQRV